MKNGDSNRRKYIFIIKTWESRGWKWLGAIWNPRYHSKKTDGKHRKVPIGNEFDSDFPDVTVRALNHGQICREKVVAFVKNVSIVRMVGCVQMYARHFVILFVLREPLFSFGYITF